ncbi:type II toxin-antitoxin system HicB family antitoxin [Dehalococcoidia bacterium]|nr:type II toxin-antitoxin system HicB family antitoxin [Dehalococcoidia bacterium]MCL0092448.1 type II toxin-antitoxin system HicB family antitoxin [Dehalococcoidia bacterium]
MKEAGYIIVNLGFRKEGVHWLGECVELGTATFGHTLEEAKDRLEEAVLLHLNTLEDVGERERFFTEHNIKLYQRKPRPRSFTVPTSPSHNMFVHSHIQRIPATVGR